MSLDFRPDLLPPLAAYILSTACLLLLFAENAGPVEKSTLDFLFIFFFGMI